MSQDTAAVIAGAIGGSSHGDDDEEVGLSASQLMGAEDLIKALNSGFDSGPARPSRVAHAIEVIVKSTIRKIEAEGE